MAASDPQKKKPRGGPKPPKAKKAEFKPKRKPLEAKQPQGLPSAVEDDVPDFPRGGGSLLSRQDREGIRAEVDAEFEAEVRASKGKNGKRTQKNGRNAEDDLGSLFGDGVTGKLPRFANRITLKNISPGMKLWGVITEINEKDLVVSLPGSLRGLVRAADAFDHDGDVDESENNLLSSMFSVGQLVSSVVLQVDDDKKEKGRRRIWLSLRLSLLQKSFTIDSIQAGMVISAYVKSIEDHGYILHFGLPSFTGFLAKSNQAGGELKPWQLIQGVVKKVDNTRKVIYLNSDSDMVSKFVTKDVKGISIDLLVPGMMVNARVQSTLENGILLSFLTYFSGTVDIFHLQSSFPTKNWRDDYTKNNKVNARILFIDPSSRAVGLTLNQHLVHNKAPPLPVTVGDIYENSRIVRVDRAHGLLLEIPSSPAVPAYVGVSDIAEEEAVKLEKKFREGSQVRARVLGFRHLEGLAVGVLKATAFEGSVFIHSDVKPGMVVRAKVVTVDTFGAIVQFPGGVKALCPLRHMSEFEIAKPRKKFKVGAELLFRVLGVKSKRITLTNKKTLVKSKLPIISSYTDATEGLITHGWITKIEKHGCFVRFYNGVQGFAPRHELGLQSGSDPSTMFHVEEVVKCRITGSVHAQRRISLSFMMKPSRISEDDLVKVGSIVSGVADSLSPRGVVVYLNAKGYSKGTIPAEHLADHHEHAVLMKSLVKPGTEFEKLVVLDIEGNNLVLSAKYSLVNAAQKLPADISDIHPNLVVNGFICNLIENGCFVRFLGRLTGFSPRKKATDELKTDLSEAFFVGQSVRSDILDVDKDGGRITVSLKQSSCSSNDASFIEAYFHSEEQIYKLQLPKSDASTTEWFESFKIGGVVEGKIQETKDYGAVVCFDKFNDIFGFVTNYQSGGSSTQTGSTVRVAILDISKRERLVDLSMKPEFVNKSTEESSKSKKEKKKRKREAIKSLNVHQTVTAVVEIVKEHYLVLSVPDYNSAVGFALKYDYNTQKFPQRQYVTGQRVDATVVALPDGSTNGRMLLLLKSVSDNGETSSSKRAKRKSGVNVGSLVQAEITEIKPLEVRLKFGLGFHGRIPVTEVSDDSALDSPFSDFKVGQTLTARIIAKSNSSDSKKNSNHWDLSVKPSIIRDSWENSENLTAGDFSYSAGQSVSGYVYKVDSEWVWITVSRNAKAQLHILDSASNPFELQEFQNRFSVGKAVSGYILTANKEKKLLRIVLHPFKVPKSVNSLIQNSNEDMALHLHEGDIVGGRISKVFPGVGGLVVQLGPSVSGRVHFAELTDSRVPDPLAGFEEGQFVKCKVIELNRTDRGTIHIDLSLRSEEKAVNVRMERIADLRPDMPVQGYVKNVTSKGCFILLSRKLDARVLLSNLSDGYVKDPEKEFPVGKLVKGKVVSVEPLSNRVEVTLKTSKGTESKSNTIDLSSLHVGDIVSGKIKRVESFGLFITIGHSNLVGLCHISEIGEERVDNIESHYRAGENVKAKILKIDEEKRRVSLGMKSSYLEDSDDIRMSSDRESDEKEDGSDDDMAVLTNDTMMAIDGEIGGSTVLAEAESRASVPPLEVSLDEIEQPDEDITFEPLQKDNDEAIVEADDKSKKRAKKKAKEERERAIRAAEERLLEKDIPRTADEFEKLVRGSPNSSYVWIKYMAYMLDLADIEKAHAIAERSLRTINIREENEKLNVWVAYFNLENKYGSPPEEAVQRVFERALQYMDPKKVYLALLSVYERNDQHKLANDLLEKMTKKFKHSCKVWLRKVQRMMKQQQEGLQSVVNRALLCLPRHKHIKFISQTAILEYKCGVPDRGRSMFERVLLEYPKRTDLWSVYLDQEIRVDDTDMVRALFERAISLSLPLKKIKFLFKKYLAYEKSKGDEERVEYVKKKAMQYAETTQG